MTPLSFIKKDLAETAKTHAELILKNFSSDASGLTSEEANKRLTLFGKNILQKEQKLQALKAFLMQWTNPLVAILVIAAIISFFGGEHIDALIIFTIVLFSTTLNFIQEYKANKAAKALEARMKTTTTVIRDGKKQEILFADVCLGEILFVSAGDLIPADARIIESKDCFINQSSLTGESYPSEKHAESKTTGTSLDELDTILFSGTNVESGYAKAVVIAIGSETEFGKIAHDLSEPEVRSDFAEGINNFSVLILRTTIFFVLFVFLFNVLLKQPLFESFMFAVAVAVGLTPELLPMILAITQSRGSVRMAARGVIVKKLSAIPNLGSMDMLCTDKTGTLTRDKIELVRYMDSLGKESDEVLTAAYANSFFQTSITNPLDDAVVNFKKMDIKGYEKVDEIPFDFVRKKMSIIVQHNGKKIFITKGAPEEVMASSTQSICDGKACALDNKRFEEFNTLYQNLSDEGYRVLAIATKEVPNDQTRFTIDDEKELSLLGLIAFLDPPKEDVAEVVKELHTMGVSIKIITGDNERVTKKICDSLGITIHGILLGKEVLGMTDDALRIAVEKNSIFARFSPDQKNRVIHALKKNGHVVGYMGDGINDAPSLRSADVGISVENAVDVAKEAAPIILTQKSLEVLLDGIREGRRTFANSMKYLMMGVSSNFGNMFSVLGALLTIPFLPMLPIQILLNNLLYDFSQITIPEDNVDSSAVLRPRKWDMKFIKKFMFVFGGISSLFDFLTFFVLYKIFSATPALFQTGWFLESLATQTLIIHIIRTRKIPFLQSKPHPLLLGSTLAVVGLGWLIPFSPIGHYFGFVAPDMILVAVLAGIVVAYLITVEFGKHIFYKAIEHKA